MKIIISENIIAEKWRDKIRSAGRTAWRRRARPKLETHPGIVPYFCSPRRKWLTDSLQKTSSPSRIDTPGNPDKTSSPIRTRLSGVEISNSMRTRSYTTDFGIHICFCSSVNVLHSSHSTINVACGYRFRKWTLKLSAICGGPGHSLLGGNWILNLFQSSICAQTPLSALPVPRARPVSRSETRVRGTACWRFPHTGMHLPILTGSISLSVEGGCLQRSRWRLLDKIIQDVT